MSKIIDGRIEKRLAAKNPAYAMGPKFSALKAQIEALERMVGKEGLHQTAGLLSKAANLIDQAKDMLASEGENL